MAGNYVCEYGTASHVETKTYVGAARALSLAPAVLEEDAKRAAMFSTEDYDAIRNLQLKIKGVDVYDRVQEFTVAIDSHYGMTRVIRLYKRGAK